MHYLSGNYYHVYNRGCNREVIFADSDNYLFLLRKIKIYLRHYPLSIIAYCLMPNHYHFLLRPETNNAVPHFIQRLFNSYVQAFNRQQNRSGTLFEGRVKSVWVDSEAYVMHLCRYIHLNPVTTRLVKQPKDWPYSNYLDWIGERDGTLKDEAFIQEHFPMPGEYERFVAEYQEEQKTAEALEKYLFD